MSIYISVILIVFVLNILGFFFAFLLKTDKITDLSYSLSFIFASIYLFISVDSPGLPKVILGSLILIWALRLGMFLFMRILNMRKDKRFDQMRSVAIRFLSFWMLQALSVCILIIPVVAYWSSDVVNFQWAEILGAFLAIVGLLTETIADRQKNNFKKKNPGKLYKEGLYKWVQFPNYTGEILFWFGIWVFGILNYNGLYHLAFISPLWIYILLRYISGIPLIRRNRQNTYTAENEIQYFKNTPLLIPNLKSLSN